MKLSGKHWRVLDSVARGRILVAEQHPFDGIPRSNACAGYFLGASDEEKVSGLTLDTLLRRGLIDLTLDPAGWRVEVTHEARRLLAHGG